MTSIPVVASTCVVCGTGGGALLLVVHYDPPRNNRTCGHWIHDNCRYEEDAPECPCGGGPAEDGVAPGQGGAWLAPEPAVDVDRDEAIPTPAELEGVSSDSDVDASDSADDISDGTDGETDGDG